MTILLRALRALFPLLRLRPWVLSVMIMLGVLTALSEGLSISPFIPLVQNQMAAGSAGLTRPHGQGLRGRSGRPAVGARLRDFLQAHTNRFCA